MKIQNLKSYGVVVLLFIGLSTLLCIQYFNKNRFRSGAEQNAQAAINHENLISINSSLIYDSNALHIYFEETELYKDRKNYIRVEVTDIFNTQLLETIRSNKGPIILYSKDLSVSTRAWMLYAQKGIKELYIFSGKENVELLNHKFQPQIN